ncbi:hypothetical protein T484DRAFT_3639491 [Baffinella frigidus]|nr:hypothetical protein T484DRAFT_3639491 [Cryptophyta sp. CCMP2293]
MHKRRHDAEPGFTVSRSWSSKATKDTIEDGASCKVRERRQSQEALNQFSRSWSSEAFSQRGTAETRAETRAVSFVASSPPSDLAVLVRERRSAVMMRVKSTREEIELDARTRNVFRTHNSFEPGTAVPGRRDHGGGVPSGAPDRKTSVAQRAAPGNVSAAQRTQSIMLSMVEPMHLSCPCTAVGQTVLQRMVAERAEREIASTNARRRPRT